MRSVEKNYPHKRVIFYGGRPDGIEPDLFVPYTQPGDSKWEKVRNTVEIICENDNLTEDFILFNDDFFIMRPVETPTNYYDGTLDERIKTIDGATFGRHAEYSDRLRHLAETLKNAGVTNPLNYAHHTPMIINRKKMLETLKKYPNEPMFRALYGNINKIGGENMPDVKFYQRRQPFPIGQYASTADESWSQEKIGQIIRGKFALRSRFER